MNQCHAFGTGLILYTKPTSQTKTKLIIVVLNAHSHVAGAFDPKPDTITRKPSVVYVHVYTSKYISPRTFTSPTTESFGRSIRSIRSVRNIHMRGYTRSETCQRLGCLTADMLY